MNRAIRIITLGLLLSMAASGVDSARAGVEGEVRSKDKVLGTILPATEIERWTIQCPKDSKLKIVLKGPKKKTGGAVSFRLIDTNDEELVGLPIIPKRTGAVLKDFICPESGPYTVEVFAPDELTGGDYSLKLICKAPRRLTFTETLDGTEKTYAFFASLVTKAKAKITVDKGSLADPRIVRMLGPEGFDVPVEGSAKAVASPKIDLTKTGDYGLKFDGDGGAVTGSLKLKPQKSVSRIVDVRSGTIDPGGAGGEDGVAGVIGPDGGMVIAPEGESPVGIEGAAIDVPAGALEGAVAIVIATAPPIGPQNETEDPVGNTVFYGPEGLEFAEDATLTLPFDPSLVETEEDVMIYTQDAQGNVTLMDPSTYVVDLLAGLVTVTTSHFSTFRVFAERGPIEVASLSETITDARAIGGVATFGTIGDGPSRQGLSDGKQFTLVVPVDVLVADGEVVKRISHLEGQGTIEQVIAGGGQSTQTGGPATDYDFSGPITAVLSKGGFASSILVATETQVFVLEPDQKSGEPTVEGLAGTGGVGDSGDGGHPTLAQFTSIAAIACDATGQFLYILDRGASRIRCVDLDAEIISTSTGTGTSGLAMDGDPLGNSPLQDPRALVADPWTPGGFFLADGGRIRHVKFGTVLDPTEQNLTYAGRSDGSTGASGDGGRRLDAKFQSLRSIAVDFLGDRLFVADAVDHTVREIRTQPGGLVRTLFGTSGTPGNDGDPFMSPGHLDTPIGVARTLGSLVILEEGGGVRNAPLPIPGNGVIIDR